MKATIIPLLAVSLGLTSCINVNTEKGDISEIFSGKKGNGPITDKTYDGNINQIQVSTSIDAEVLKSDTEKVVISAPSDIMEFIKVENNGGNLRIFVNSGFGRNISTQNVKAKIYVKDFTGL